MNHNEFKIGTRFFTGTGEWICTDVGTRTISAVKRKSISNSGRVEYVTENSAGFPEYYGELVFNCYDMDASSLDDWFTKGVLNEVESK